MTMLYFPEDLNYKKSSFEEMTAFYISIIYKDFFTNVSKNDLGDLHKITLTPVEGIFWP